MEKSVERAALASLKSTSAATAPVLPDEKQKMLDLNFRVPLERPVALDATVSDKEWEHFRRIIHFYVDFRLKKVRSSWFSVCAAVSFKFLLLRRGPAVPGRFTSVGVETNPSDCGPGGGYPSSRLGQSGLNRPAVIWWRFGLVFLILLWPVQVVLISGDTGCGKSTQVPQVPLRVLLGVSCGCLSFKLCLHSL
jgi:hypothetical protein